MGSVRKIQRYTEKQDASVPKEKSVQSVYTTCNDIWMSNWAVTKRMQDRLKITQRSMERAMIGITKRGHRINEWVRQQTGVQNIIVRIQQLKRQCAGHVARICDNR